MIQYDYSEPIESYEKAGIFSRIISFLIPLVGIILYLYFDENKPVKSKTCGRCAGLGILVQVIIYTIAKIAIKAWFNNLINTYIG